MADQPIGRRVVDRYKERGKEIARGMAARLGPPASGEKVSREEAVKMWSYMDPAVDEASVRQQLLTGQLTSAEAVNTLYPYRMALIGKGSPTKVAERAESLAKLAAAAAERTPAVPEPAALGAGMEGY